MPIAGTEAVLSTLIQAEMAGNGITILEPAELAKLTDAIAKAVIDHIVANATVTVPGITPGPSAATGSVG